MIDKALSTAVDAVAGFFGDVFGEVFVERRRARRSALAARFYGSGVPVEIVASTSGLALHTERWVLGDLEVEPGSVIWHQRYGKRASGAVVEAGAFVAEGLRTVTVRESWSVNTDCLVLAGVFDGNRVEIAASVDDMSLIVDALRVGHLLD